MQCRSGIGPLTSLDSVYKHVLPVGEVKLSTRQLAETADVTSRLTRTSLLGLHAAKEALVNSGIEELSPWRTGLVSATTVGGMDRTEVFFPEFLRKRGRLRDVVQHGCGTTTECIADHLGIRHFVSTINTACSSSVNSIMLGARMIRHDLLDIAVAGGTDAMTKFTLNGFKSLMILDNELCKPFDAHRKGLNLGEGAGYVVLASERVIRERKLTPKVLVSGYGNRNDAHHQTASSPEGNGSHDAMEKALAMADLAPQAIRYLNLHGTGTVNNDLSESVAIKRLFGAQYPKISSTKAYTGHTLGASGGVEAVFSVMAIDKQCVFPNLRFSTPIPETGLVPQLEPEYTAVDHVMSNSFGFGGNCSSIIFSAVKETDRSL